MIQNALKKAKKMQQTRPNLYKNFFMFGDTSEISTNILYNLITTKTEYNTEEYKAFDRYHLTASQEQHFNSKFSPFVKNIIKYKHCHDFDLLLDFFVRNFYIQEYNKEELLFVILPFAEYNYQINHFENKLSFLQGMPKTYNIQFFATLAYKNLYFFDFILDYFSYYEITKEFLQKIILEMCKLDQKEAIMGRLYVVLEELVKNKDYEFFTIAYDKLEAKYEFTNDFDRLKQKVQETDWYKNKKMTNDKLEDSLCIKINYTGFDNKSQLQKNDDNNMKYDDKDITKDEYKELSIGDRIKILNKYKSTNNKEKISSLIGIMSTIELECINEYITGIDYRHKNINEMLKVIDKNYIAKNIQKIANNIVKRKNAEFDTILPFITKNILVNMHLDTQDSYQNFIMLANKYNEQFAVTYENDTSCNKIVEDEKNRNDYTKTQDMIEADNNKHNENNEEHKNNNINEVFDINKHFIDNLHINQYTIEMLLQKDYVYTEDEFKLICDYITNTNETSLYINLFNYVTYMIEKQKFTSIDILKQIIAQTNTYKELTEVFFVMYEAMISNKIEDFDDYIKEIVTSNQINIKHAKLYQYIIKKDKKLIHEIMNKQESKNNIFCVFSDVLCFEDIFLHIKTYNEHEIDEIQKNYNEICDAILKTNNKRNLKAFTWYLLQLIENNHYTEEITKLILDNKQIACVLLEFTTSKLAIALYCECITKHKDLLQDITKMINTNPTLLLDSFYNVFTNYKEYIQFDATSNIIATILSCEGYETEKKSIINHLARKGTYDLANINQTIKYCDASICVVLVRKYKNILVVHTKDIISKFIAEYFEDRTKLYKEIKYKENNSIDEFVNEFVILNHYEVIKAIFTLLNEDKNMQKHKFLLHFLISYLTKIDDKYIKQIVKTFTNEMKKHEESKQYNKVKLDYINIDTKSENKNDISMQISDDAKMSYVYINNDSQNVKIQSSDTKIAQSEDIILLYQKLLVSFILYCSKYEYKQNEMQKLLSLFDFNTILCIFEQIVPFSFFYFTSYITICLEEIENNNFRSIRCVEMYYKKATELVSNDNSTLLEKICYKLLTLSLEDRKYEKCFISVLNHIKSENLLQEINKIILKRMLENNACFVLLEILYKNITEYKVCIKNSISFFTLCLDNKDSEIQDKTKKLLSKIQKHTGENIEDYFM